VASCNQSWYDIVIPNYFDLSEFEYSSDKEDYFLFIGRVYDGKGLNVAMQVTEAIGAKLKVAGQLADNYAVEDFKWPDHVEFIGYADLPTRRELMKGAIASFLPSMYVEPFGGVQIENLISGTPTITTDWGAFSENNIQGRTGYRCRTFEEFVKAAVSCRNGDIKSIHCREQGEMFSLKNIAPKYEKFFTYVTDIYDGNNGWYAMRDESMYTDEWKEKQRK